MSSDKWVAIRESDLKELKAWARTLDAEGVPLKMCPKCEEYVLVRGHVCAGCQFDNSDTTEEDEENWYMAPDPETREIASNEVVQKDLKNILTKAEKYDKIRTLLT